MTSVFLREEHGYGVRQIATPIEADFETAESMIDFSILQGTMDMSKRLSHFMSNASSSLGTDAARRRNIVDATQSLNKAWDMVDAIKSEDVKASATQIVAETYKDQEIQFNAAAMFLALK